MHPSSQEVVAIAAGASFAAGLNVYATVATLGLLGRAGVVELPPALHLLQGWPVIAVAAALFVIEFFADKIPAFDLIWNALHTFVRVPAAALLTYGATAQLSPGAQIAVAVGGGLIALAAHGGKMAARAAVTPSPEPLSNTALSLGEDVVAIGLTWLATRHPYIAAGAVLVALLIIVVLVRWVLRAMRQLFSGAWRELERMEGSAP
ncbi:MAG TPA: DUF4126 domain-containing protein [Terriglobales bacterium]|nr:DUF4126 domain-containing protein [Terriglobales bacterium]